MQQTGEIRELLSARQIAALGTLHNGEPFVSMVPFVWQEETGAFVIHVSKLATHTGDMLAEPRVSFLISSVEQDDIPAQALPRITIQGFAKPIEPDTELYTTAKGKYIERFPMSAPIFGLGDFILFSLTPNSARYIAGFGRAFSLTASEIVNALK